MLGLDNILKRCVLYYEIQDVLWDCHSGVVGSHVGGKATAQKFLQAGLWWPCSSKMKMHMVDVATSIKKWEIH
jgi:hypothetical protein